MLVTAKTKTTLKTTASRLRWQITLPKNTPLDKRIHRLLAEYDGLNLVEITKLALIELDKKNSNYIDDILDAYNTGNINGTAVENKTQLENLLEEMSK